MDQNSKFNTLESQAEETEKLICDLKSQVLYDNDFLRILKLQF